MNFLVLIDIYSNYVFLKWFEQLIFKFVRLIAFLF